MKTVNCGFRPRRRLEASTSRDSSSAPARLPSAAAIVRRLPGRASAACRAQQTRAPVGSGQGAGSAACREASRRRCERAAPLSHVPGHRPRRLGRLAAAHELGRRSMGCPRRSIGCPRGHWSYFCVNSQAFFAKHKEFGKKGEHAFPRCEHASNTGIYCNNYFLIIAKPP